MRKKPSKASAKTEKVTIIRKVTRTYNEVPNEETLRAIAAYKKEKKDKTLKGYTTTAAFMKSLEH